MDDARLVELVRGGSTPAAEQLFLRYWPLAWKVAYAVTGDRTLADDAAQEAIHQAFRSLDAYDPERPFAPWLRGIAAHRAIDQLRRERRAARAEEPPDVPAPEAAARDDVLAALAALSAEKRAVVLLRYWLDLPLDEIATLLGVPFGTVASRLSRAHAELRELLKEDQNHVA